LDYHDYFTEEALEKLRAAFHGGDAPSPSESIPTDELAAAFRRMGRVLTKQQVRDLAKQVVSDDRGVIEFEEFCILEIMLSGLRPHVNLINYRDYLSNERVASLERRFVQEDVQNAGAVPLAKVLRICEDMGCSGMTDELQELFKQADTENRGTVEFHHVCAIFAVAKKCRRKCNYREFLSAEQVATFNKVFFSAVGEHGRYSMKMLDKLMRRLGLTVKPYQLNWLMETFDLDGSGDIDFEEFCIMMLRLKGVHRQRVITPQTCSCEDLWRNEKFTVKELRRSGFTLKDFKEIGIPVALLVSEGGISPLEFRRAGYTCQDLRRGGVSAAELRRCGFSLADLRIAGFSDGVLQVADRELKGSLSAGDLSLLAQQRPPSRGRVGPVRGAVLSNAGAVALSTPSIWQLPPRPMTQMIREHTDWQPKLSRQFLADMPEKGASGEWPVAIK